MQHPRSWYLDLGMLGGYVGEVVIEIPDRVGRTGYGPGAGQFKEELDAYHHPEGHA